MSVVLPAPFGPGSATTSPAVTVNDAVSVGRPRWTTSRRLGRWFLEAPIHDDGRTWLLSKMWGTTTEAVLERLLALAPVAGFGFEPGPET